jgi:catechol 2,3-dioxygenase-like lactoylglutathione lyase family enzyme
MGRGANCGVMKPPPIEGIVESILYVENLERAVAFYRDELGLEPMVGDAVRFQALRAGANQVLLLFKRGGTLEPVPVSPPGSGVIPPHDGRGPHHIGFAVTASAYDAWIGRLRERRIAIESEATWERGGRSVYFRDPDGHLVELITPGIWPNY